MRRTHPVCPAFRSLAFPIVAFLGGAACSSADAPPAAEPARAARGAMDGDSVPLQPVGYWQDRTTLGAVRGAGIAYDRKDGAVLLFGGLRGPGEFLSDTWRWDGVRWLRLHPSSSPPARAMTAMAYDESREKTVLFSGTSFNPLPDTWEWNGTTWTERSAGAPPPAREDHRMAFDPVKNKLIVFGGWSLANQQVLGDTWSWDGAVWEKLADGPPLAGVAMTRDRKHGRVVRFGGHDQGYDEVDTIAVWDGAAWTPLDVSGAPAPAPRFGASLAFDEANDTILLFGGLKDDIVFDETWQLKGATWSMTTADPRPSARLDFAMEWDGARTLLAGGSTSGADTLSDTWSWDGAWSKSEASNPLASMHPALAHDEERDVVVLFGGFDGASTAFAETWEWDGDWRRRSPAQSPPARYAHAMAYDAEQGVTVLFGGRRPGKVFGDTWLWDGSIWQDVTPQSSPAPRWDAVMAYDHERKLIILHGGADDADAVGDETWAWNADGWKLLPVKGPGIRSQHAMAEDRARGQLVLFGGVKGVSSMANNETWRWDGTSWSQKDTPSAPTARVYHAMTYNPIRQRVILFGGLLTTTFSDVWEWDGGAWSLVPFSGGPPALSRVAMAFSGRERAAVLFGGSPAGPPYGKTSDATWLYRTRGGSCAEDAACDTQHCAIAVGDTTGVCCEEASCPLCYTCDAEGSPGVCAPALKDTPCGEPVSCGDGCKRRRLCDGAGVCTEGEPEPYVCTNTAECGEGLTCSADHLCVTDVPFAPPDLGCAVSVPAKTEGGHGCSVVAAVAALCVARLRRRRPVPVARLGRIIAREEES